MDLFENLPNLSNLSSEYFNIFSLGINLCREDPEAFYLFLNLIDPLDMRIQENEINEAIIYILAKYLNPSGFFSVNNEDSFIFDINIFNNFLTSRSYFTQNTKEVREKSIGIFINLLVAKDFELFFGINILDNEDSIKRSVCIKHFQQILATINTNYIEHPYKSKDNAFSPFCYFILRKEKTAVKIVNLVFERIYEFFKINFIEINDNMFCFTYAEFQLLVNYYNMTRFETDSEINIHTVFRI